MKTLLALLLGLGLLFPSFGGPTNETASASSEHLLSRFYRIDPDAFVGNLKKSVSAEAGDSNQDLLVRLFNENHIQLEKPSAVLLDEKRRVLSITTTKADQDRIERILINKKLLRSNIGA
jgi:hypothetical protein